MNQKELIQTFMMISKFKKIGFHGLCKKYFDVVWVNRLDTRDAYMDLTYSDSIESEATY